MNYNYLLIEKSGRHAIIEIHRPECKNALNPELISELKHILNDLEPDREILSVTITGSRVAFCSGADLEYLQSIKTKTLEEQISDSNHLAELLYKIFSFKKPVIAKVYGPALAGGCGLVSVCDYVFADEQAVFGYPEVKIGFIPAVVSLFLIRLVGERKAREMLIFGKKYSAQEALEIGLINYCGKCEELELEYNKLQQIIESNSPLSMMATKALFYDELLFPLREKIYHVSNINAQSRQTADFSEGISAFLEKRKPYWK